MKEQLALLQQINRRLYDKLVAHAASAQKLHEDLDHTAHAFQVTGQPELPLGKVVPVPDGLQVLTGDVGRDGHEV